VAAARDSAATFGISEISNWTMMGKSSAVTVATWWNSVRRESSAAQLAKSVNGDYGDWDRVAANWANSERWPPFVAPSGKVAINK
jgi:hypothetical protein